MIYKCKILVHKGLQQRVTFPIGALFTSSGRISVRREAPDGDNCDEGIAHLAIVEEQSIVRWGLTADRKLTEEVNKAPIGEGALCCNPYIGQKSVLRDRFQLRFLG